MFRTFLLNLWFDNCSEPPFKYQGINFPRKADKCDSLITGALFPVPIFENVNHRPGLPLHRYCPWSSCYTEEVCQPRQCNKWPKGTLGQMSVIHTSSFAAEQLSGYISNFCHGYGWGFPQVFRLCLLYRGHVSLAQELLKVLLPCSSISPVAN